MECFKVTLFARRTACSSGNLASNLARIKSRCQNTAHGEIIEDLLQESKLFIEWTAADTEIEIAAELVELQVQLACWQYSWAGFDRTFSNE